MSTILLLSFETGFLCPETSSIDQADLEPASLLLARFRGAPLLLLGLGGAPPLLSN